MYKKILAPIDGSESSYDALKMALELAKVHESEVEILHVMMYSENLPQIDSSQIKSNNPQAYVEDYIARVKKKDENMLSSALEDARKIAPEAKVSTKLMLGEPAEEIIGEAARGEFDLIVIGSRGMSGLKELILGSVSHKVVNGSQVPVLVVK